MRDDEDIDILNESSQDNEIRQNAGGAIDNTNTRGDGTYDGKYS